MSMASEVGAQHTAARAQEVADKLAQKRFTMGDALALNVLEALEIWAVLAEDPAQPAYLVAKDQLRRFANVWERANAVRAGIHLPTAQPAGGNGRA